VVTPFKRRHPALKFDDMHSDRIQTAMKRRRIPIWSEAKGEDNRFVHNLARIGAKCVGEALRQEVLAPVRELSAKRIKERPAHQCAA